MGLSNLDPAEHVQRDSYGEDPTHLIGQWSMVVFLSLPLVFLRGFQTRGNGLQQTGRSEGRRCISPLVGALSKRLR